MVLVTKKPKRAGGAPTKQRAGRHHKKDEHYLKPYWPYIPMVLIVVLGMAFSSLWGAMQHGVLSYATEMSGSALLQGTNTQRASNGIGGLAYNNTLAAAAQAKANDMVARNYWSHNTPEGDAPWVFISNAGYTYTTAGENLAYGFGTSDATIAGWMNSPGHKANILNSSFTEVGFGFANSADFQGTGPETIVVAMYAAPKAVAVQQAAPAPAAKAAPAPAAAQAKPATTPTETPAPADPSETDTQKTAEATQKANEIPTESNAIAAAGAAKPPAANNAVTTQNVSRIQLATNGQAPWSVFAVTMLATVAVVVFFLRHAIFWHRALVKGEAFFMHHKLFDIALVGVGVLGYILTRSAGVIH